MTSLGFWALRTTFVPACCNTHTILRSPTLIVFIWSPQQTAIISLNNIELLETDGMLFLFLDVCITMVMQREIRLWGQLSTPHFAGRFFANQVRTNATQRMPRNIRCLTRFGTLPMRQSALLSVPRSTFTYTTNRATCRQPWASATVAPAPMHGNPRQITLVIDNDIIQWRRRRYATPKRANCYWTEQLHDSLHTDRSSVEPNLSASRYLHSSGPAPKTHIPQYTVSKAPKTLSHKSLFWVSWIQSSQSFYKFRIQFNIILRSVCLWNRLQLQNLRIQKCLCCSPVVGMLHALSSSYFWSWPPQQSDGDQQKSQSSLLHKIRHSPVTCPP